MTPPKTKAAFSTDWQSHPASTAAIKRFEETFAKEMGVDASRDTKTSYDVIPTGSLAIDYALGIGGIPTGRITEIWGPEHAGKTTLSVLIAVEAQRKFPDKMVAWIDMEQTFDTEWAQTLGLDLARVWRPPVKTAEEVADFTKRFTMSGLCSLVVIDSVGGMLGQAEYEKEADEATVAIVAKIVTRMVKQSAPICAANGTALVIINQVRANIGAHAKAPQTGTAGGWALKHVTTIRMSVKRGGELPKFITVDGEQVPVGYLVAVKVEKNKCAPYGKKADFWLFNQATDKFGGIGVDPFVETVEFGKKLGIISGSGWLVLPSGEKFNGAAKTAEHLREHPEVMNEIRTKVLATLSGVAHDETDEGAEDPADMAAFLADVRVGA